MYYLKDKLNISAHYIDVLEYGYSDTLPTRLVNEFRQKLIDMNLVYISFDVNSYNEFAKCDITNEYSGIYQCTFYINKPIHLIELTNQELIKHVKTGTHTKINDRDWYIRNDWLIKA